MTDSLNPCINGLPYYSEACFSFELGLKAGTLTTGAHGDWDLNQSSHSYDPNVLPLSYPVSLLKTNGVSKPELSLCMYSAHTDTNGHMSETAAEILMITTLTSLNQENRENSY